MKVSDLSDARLNYWVAKAAGIEIIDDGDGGWFETEFYNNYSPSSEWDQGGPIIEREKMNFNAVTTLPGKGGVYAWTPEWRGGALWGETHLIAAMRAYIASKFGEEVPNE